ncbi:MAG: hypothetical protein PVI68_10290, partial [Anaerolineae bacterium]
GPTEQFGVSTARIDFDYLSPQYPVLRPAQPLLALAQDLRRLFTDPSQDYDYTRFRERVVSFHAELSNAPLPDDPLDSLRGRRFSRIITDFAALLKNMPGRVVLILDTCEELIKEQLGGRLPHLDATFLILERIHEELPTVRVILAGRRLLARGGQDWLICQGDLPEAKGYLVEPKPYLRLYLMRGFDDGEAHQLFDKRPRKREPLPDPDGTESDQLPEGNAPEEIPVPADIRQAILAVSPERGTPARVYAADGRPHTLTPDLFVRLCETLAASPAIQQPRRLEGLFDDPRLRSWRDELPVDGTPADRAQAIIYLLHNERDHEREHALVLLLRRLAGEPGLEEAHRAGLEALAGDLARHLARHNPYTLDLYSKWFQDDPDLTSQVIQSGKIDPYIEMRIVQRISEDDVRDLLPATVKLRHFNAQMLEPAFSGSHDAFQAAFQALSDQEWMRYDRDPDTDEIMLRVDGNLHPQMVEYFEQAAPEALAAAGERLAPSLAERVRHTPLAQLGLAPINAALSLLPDREAAQLWSELESRIVPEDYSWGSVQRIMRFLLGAEFGAAGGGPSLLRAAVRATQTAVGLQTSATDDPGIGWSAVARTLAQLDPVEQTSPLGQWLAHRVLLGQIAAGQFATDRVTRRPPAEEQLARFDQIKFDVIADEPPELTPEQRAQRLAAFLAASEFLLDSAEEEGTRPVLNQLDLKMLQERQEDPRLGAFALALAARAALLRDEPRQAAEDFARAEALAVEYEAEWWGQPKPWTDWRAPDSLRDRIRLEMLRLLPQPPDQNRLSRWLQEAARPATRVVPPDSEQVLSAMVDRLLSETAWPARRDVQIDSERLLSAVLDRLLDVGVAPAGFLERLEELARYQSGRRPVCLAHRQTPPLFVTLARSWLARGDVGRAMASLERQSETGIQAVDETGVVAASLQGRIEIARRMRQQDQSKALLDLVGYAQLPEEAPWPAAVLAGAVLPGELPPPNPTWSPECLHAWWSCQYDLTPDRLEQAQVVHGLLAKEFGEFPRGPRLYTLLALALDAEERALLIGGQDTLWTEDERAHLYSWFYGLIERYPHRLPRRESEMALRLFLRAIAIQASCFTPIYGRPEFVNLLADPAPLSPESVSYFQLLNLLRFDVTGSRRAAEIALEEGELLALRMPGLAAQLLLLAQQWFDETAKSNLAHLRFEDMAFATLGVQAGILAASCAARVGSHEVVQSALDAVQTNYEQLQENGRLVQAPDWSDLPFIEPDKLAQQDGGEWLVRLHACRVWYLNQLPAKTSVDLLRTKTWLERQYGQRPTPELRLFLAQPNIEPELEPDLSAAEEELSDRELFLILGGLLLGAAAILVGLFFAFRWLIDRLTGGLGVGWTIGLYVLLWVLLVAAINGLPALRDRLRARLTASMTVSARISSPYGVTVRGADLALRESVGVTIELQRGSRWEIQSWPPPFVFRTEPQTGSYHADASLLRPYVWSARGFPTGLVEDLGALTALLGGRSVPVELQIDDALLPYPWEALLSLSVQDLDRQFWHEPLHFYRTGDLQPVTPLGWQGGVAVVTGETWSGLFEQGWQAANLGVAVRRGLDIVQAREPVKVLHLVGRPIRTQAGLRLQIDVDGFEQSSMAVEQSAMGRAGLLVSADKLPLSQTWLVVVQGDPVEGVARREADREDAAYLRIIAAEMLRAGSRAVLVLPSMPPELARQVVVRLGKALRLPSSVDKRRFLKAVSSVRREIIDWQYVAEPLEGGASEPWNSQEFVDMLVELALDVCLYWQAGEISDYELKERMSA